MYGSKVLRREADSVAAVDAEVSGLVQDLFDTLEEADGVGLAAPQIGVSRRVIVVDISGAEPNAPPIALVNPVIDIGQGMATAEEGCLSIPDVYGDVSRYTNIEVTALDQAGEPFKLNAEGFMARVLQHEIDHLEGVFFVDRLTATEKLRVKSQLLELESAYRTRA